MEYRPVPNSQVAADSITDDHAVHDKPIRQKSGSFSSRKIGSHSPTRSRPSPVEQVVLEDEEDQDKRSIYSNNTRGTGRRRLSSFEFDEYAIPLSLSLINKYGELDDLGKSVGFFNGIALIVGMCIGSGIFASPGPILSYTGSVGAALLVWLLAGILAITGALCYAELGTMMPSSGGEHPYLLKSFDSSLPAFLFSWTGITVTRPGSVAIISIIFAEYVCRLIYYAHPVDAVPPLLIRTIACLCILSLTFINALSTKLGTLVQNVFTIMKLLSLATIGVVGIRSLVSAHQVGQHSTNFDQGIFSQSSLNPGNYALALFSALWAYDGWNNLNLVTGELKDPAKNLPRAILTGTSVVICCYLLANFAYYADFGKAAFGSIGGILIPVAVIGSTFGAANATVFSSARVIYVSAKHGHAPRILGNVHPQTHTPVNALILQGVLSMIFVSVGSFKSLVNLFSMIAWTFYLLAVLGLILLRYKEPYLERPYKVWMIAPVTFCLVSASLIGFSIMEAPVEALGAVGFLTSGIPAWWLTVKKKVSLDDITSFLHRLFRIKPSEKEFEYQLDEMSLNISSDEEF